MAAVEPERQRIEEEPKGWRSLTEWSSEAQDGQRQTKAGKGGTRELGGASGQMGHGGEEGARSHCGADGSVGRGGIRCFKAGGAVKGFSDHGNTGEWQSRGAHTV